MTGKITRKCMLWASCVWILIGAAVLSIGANLAVLSIPEVRRLTWVERAGAEERGRPRTGEGPIAGSIEME